MTMTFWWPLPPDKEDWYWLLVIVWVSVLLALTTSWGLPILCAHVVALVIWVEYDRWDEEG